MNSAMVIGAGPVGCLTALGLAKLGWKVRLIEKLTCPDNELPSSYDDRQLALSEANVSWLQASGLLPNLMAHLTPMLSIHTSAQDGFGVMVMSAQEQGVPALGYSIGMDQLGVLLFAEVHRAGNITLCDGVTLMSLSQDDQAVSLQTVQNAQAETWQADYLFACDGMNSWVRSTLGIGQSRYDYDHGLMTAIATLQNPHQYRAVERFTAQGPTALLPMSGTHLAKVVFSYPLAEKEQVQSANTAWLTAQINHQLGRTLGTVVAIHGVKHYTAVDMRADHILDRRCVLLGNSAHTQHPVAGQGLNLGFRDVIAVLDWAQDPRSVRLALLAQTRQQDHQRIMGFTAGLNRLFTHPSVLVRRISGVGVGVLQACLPLKKLVTRVAMGRTA